LEGDRIAVYDEAVSPNNTKQSLPQDRDNLMKFSKGRPALEKGL
jgi:hypothetical protein